MDRFDIAQTREYRYSEDSARGFHGPAPEFRPMWRCLLSISIDTLVLRGSDAVSCTARLTIAGKRSDLGGKVPEYLILHSSRRCMSASLEALLSAVGKQVGLNPLFCCLLPPT